MAVDQVVPKGCAYSRTVTSTVCTDQVSGAVVVPIRILMVWEMAFAARLLRDRARVSPPAPWRASPVSHATGCRGVAAVASSQQPAQSSAAPPSCGTTLRYCLGSSRELRDSVLDATDDACFLTVTPALDVLGNVVCCESNHNPTATVSVVSQPASWGSGTATACAREQRQRDLLVATVMGHLPSYIDS